MMKFQSIFKSFLACYLSVRGKRLKEEQVGVVSVVAAKEVRGDGRVLAGFY